MHKYFSSEDLDLRKLTKFILYFLHFSLIYYAITKFQQKSIKRNKPPLTLLTRGPYLTGREREGRLPCSAPAAHPDGAARLH